MLGVSLKQKNEQLINEEKQKNVSKEPTIYVSTSLNLSASEKISNESSANVSQKVDSILPSQPLEDTKNEPGLISQIFTAMDNGEFWKAELLISDLLKTIVDATEKVKTEVAFRVFGYRSGDTKSISRLKDMAGNPDFAYFAHIGLGKCYERKNDEKALIEYNQAAVSNPPSPLEEVTAYIYSAQCFFRLNKRDQAFDLLKLQLEKAASPEICSEIYKAIADLYKDLNDWNLRSIALEKALENQPNDIDIMFELAFAYSEAKDYPTALLHYQNLLNMRPNNAPALNNLGVALGYLQLNMNSNEAYKKAHQSGETLASSNLANNFINSGFREEAKEIIDFAIKQKELHPIIGDVMSHLEKEWLTEEEKKKNIIESARDYKSHIVKFANAFFESKNGHYDFSGSWTFDGEDMIITQNADKIEGVFEHRKIKFSGYIKNSGSILDVFSKKVFAFSPGDANEYVNSGKGYLYFINSNLLHFIYKSSKGYEYFNFSRKKETLSL